jgi:phosphotriesterase-related protein
MIHTARGAIDKKEMGRTLAHEHVCWEYDESFAGRLYFDKVCDEKYNGEVAEQVLPLLLALRSSGCRTIVEASPPLGGQNPRLLYDLSVTSDIHIIPCTGMNISKYAYRLFPEHFVQQLSARWIEDFRSGLDTVGNTIIRPGFIKLLFDRGGVSAVDRAMLEAAMSASEATGMAIHCHVLEAEPMSEVMQILEARSFPPHKFLWAHADRESNLEMILNVTGKGYWVGFDTIREGRWEARKELIDHAVHNRYQDQVLLSTDNDLREESRREGACERYQAFFELFLPFCIKNGISGEILEKMITDNPARFYDI